MGSGFRVGDEPMQGFNPQVTSAFMYVRNLAKSVEFYTEIVGAEVRQLHSDEEDGPLTLAILRLGTFTLMLHPQDSHEEEFRDQRMGLGMHLQLRVDDVDAFYRHCEEQMAFAYVSGQPVDQPWGWREFALKDPDGYVWSVYQDNSGGQWS